MLFGCLHNMEVHALPLLLTIIILYYILAIPLFIFMANSHYQHINVNIYHVTELSLINGIKN